MCCIFFLLPNKKVSAILTLPSFFDTLTASSKKFQQKENQHAGHRYVQPNWKSPAGDPWMADKIICQCKIDRRQNHRQHDGGQNDVRDENEKIDRTDQAGAKKWCVAMKMMVGHVRDQEQRRERQGA